MIYIDSLTNSNTFNYKNWALYSFHNIKTLLKNLPWYIKFHNNSWELTYHLMSYKQFWWSKRFLIEGYPLESFLQKLI